jgi:phospholipid/cholesterol/gamma-HCH transport system permease protein
MINSLLAKLGRSVLNLLDSLGKSFQFTGLYFRYLLSKPRRVHLCFQQMSAIGVGSIPIILLVSLFTGAVFALQTGYAFRLFNAETLVGSTVAITLSRELAPVFTALMLTSRAGSAMAAELGTMRVTEQIDALETMAVNPYQYLVIPRVTATAFMAPMLTMLFNFVGFMGAYFVAVFLLDIPEGPLLNRVETYVDPDDLLGGLFKSVIFGFILAMVSCYQGYLTKGGAKGVGEATKKAVVISSVLILVVDYFLTQWILEIL